MILGRRLAAAGVLAATAAAILWAVAARAPAPEEPVETQDRPPVLRPDYADVTVPPNLAPLNFRVVEPGDAYAVRVRGASGDPLEVRSRTPAIRFPAGAWRDMLAANRGGRLAVEVLVRGGEGRWRRLRPFAWTVAPEEIDRFLVYRFFRSLYNKYVTMALRQRDLATYEEIDVLRNQDVAQGCVNCHTFHAGDPGRMLLHVRGPAGPAMVLVREGRLARVDTRTPWNASPATYSAWHPDGRRVAFSVNALTLFFHSVGETRDVFDADSDLGVYDTETNTVTSAPALARPDRLETWPAWAPDGRHLYFSSAPRLPKERFAEVRYDLVRVAWDGATGRWGDPETVLAAAEAGGTLLEPRVSPDGRWLLFTLADYGNFPVYRPSADLAVLDLETRAWRRLACNSDRCESYHAWSSNGRWIVFSSKRMDGVFARPHFSYIDASGEARKPFVLPQEDPDFYDSLPRTYNTPELARGPVPVTGRALARVAVAPREGERLAARLDPSTPLPAGGPAPGRPPAAPGDAPPAYVP